jgi:hypothetical protein
MNRARLGAATFTGLAAASMLGTVPRKQALAHKTRLQRAVQLPVFEPSSQTLLHILGVDHTSPRSVIDVAILFKQLSDNSNGSIRGVAVELDEQTAESVLTCSQAFQSLSDSPKQRVETIKRRGDQIIRDELFKLESIHMKAARESRLLKSSDEIVLPALMKQSLSRGVLWGEEMAKVSHAISSTVH